MPREMTLQNPAFPTIVPTGDTLLVGSSGTEEAPCDGKFSVDALGEALGVFRLIAGETTIADGLGVPDYEGSPLVADATFGGVLPTTDDLYDPVIWFLWVPESAEMIGLHRNKSSNVVDMIRGYGGTTAEWIAPDATIYLLRAAQIPTIADLNAWGGDTSALEAMIESGLLTKADVAHTHEIEGVLGLESAIGAINSELELKAYSTAVQAGFDAIDTVLDSVDAAFEAVDTALDGKSGTGHTHTIANVTGLQTALDGKSGTGHNHDGSYAPVTHSHGQDQVTGLVDALAAIDDELAALGDTALDHEARLDELEAAEGGGGGGGAKAYVYRSGKRYPHAVAPTRDTGNFTLTKGNVYWVPVIPAEDITINRLGVWIVTGISGAYMRLGVYSSSGALPATRLSTTSNVFVESSGASVDESMSSVALTAGTLYFLSIWTTGGSGDVVVAGLTGGGNLVALGGDAVDQYADGVAHHYYDAIGASVPPATYSSHDGEGAFCPVIWFATA